MKNLITYINKNSSSVNCQYKPNEQTKQQFERIINHSEEITNKEWEQILKSKNKLLIEAIIKSENVPEEILFEAISLCEDSYTKLEALSRKQPHYIIDKILEDSESKREFLLGIHANQRMVVPYKLDEYYNKENINYIAQNVFYEKISTIKFGILGQITDENMVLQMVKSDKLTSEKLLYLISNRNISEELRNNMFDAIGFNYNDIECPLTEIIHPTQYLAEKIYSSATQTLEMVDDELAHNKYNNILLFKEATEKIHKLYKENAMTESMQLNYINLKINFLSNVRNSDIIIEKIISETSNPAILLQAYNLKSKDKQAIFNNPKCPVEIIELEYDKIMKKIRNSNKFGYPPKLTQPEYFRFLNMCNRIPVSKEDFFEITKCFLEDSMIARNIVTSPATPIETLNAIVESSKTKPQNKRNYSPIFIAKTRLHLMQFCDKEEAIKLSTILKTNYNEENQQTPDTIKSRAIMDEYLEQNFNTARERLKSLKEMHSKETDENLKTLIGNAITEFSLQIEKFALDNNPNINQQTSEKLRNEFNEILASIKNSISEYEFYRRIIKYEQRCEEIMNELDRRDYKKIGIENIER